MPYIMPTISLSLGYAVTEPHRHILYRDLSFLQAISQPVGRERIGIAYVAPDSLSKVHGIA